MHWSRTFKGAASVALLLVLAAPALASTGHDIEDTRVKEDIGSEQTAVTQTKQQQAQQQAVQQTMQHVTQQSMQRGAQQAAKSAQRAAKSGQGHSH